MAERSYHHGDLRRAVLDAALDVIGTDGPAAISMRDLARRAGVSHAAPAHHFGDKSGLLTAIAVDGFELLAEYLTDAVGRPDELRELGVAYVRFAIDHPAHFEVMFRRDLCHDDAPELIAARERTAGLLRGGVDTVTTDDDSLPAMLAAWSLAHGFATLWQGGSIERDADPAEAFRAISRHLFTRPD